MSDKNTIDEDKKETDLAAGCFGAIMALMMLLGVLMFMGTPN